MDKYFGEDGLFKSEFIEDFMKKVNADDEMKKEIRVKLNYLILNKLTTKLNKVISIDQLPKVNSVNDLENFYKAASQIMDNPKFQQTIDDFFSFGIKVELDQLKMDSK